jgi:hypothetical protein
MPVFLRAYSGKSRVYEVAHDADGITVNIGPPANPGTVDRIEFLDPGSSSGNPVVQFSVFSSSLRSSGRDPLWKKLDFQTRCFLTREGVDNLAHVILRLDDNAKVTDFEILDQTPTEGPPLPAPITSLSQFTFVYQVSAPFSFGPPKLLEKLGLAFYGAVDWRNPTLVCCPQADGPKFQVNLDLAGDEQELIPYGIEFGSRDTTLPAGSDTRHSLTFWQRTARVDPMGTEPIFWILGLNLPPGIVLNGWNDAIVTPFLESLNLVRSGLPASFVPKLDPLAGEQTSFNVTFALVDQAPSLKQVTGVLRDPESPLVPGRLNIVTRTIELPSGSVKCGAVFPNLQREDGQALQAQCLIGPLPGGASSYERVRESQAGYCLGFQHTFDLWQISSVTPQPAVRMGALNLLLPDVPANPTDLGREFGSLRASLRAIRKGDNDDIPSKLVRIDYLNMQLAVTALGIGGQDDVPGSEYAPLNQPYPRGASSTFRRARALQIPLPGKDFPAIGAYFVLDVSETCYELTSQTLALQLEQQLLSTGSGALDLIVFDPEPFLIARVSVPDYQQSLREALTNQVASWDNSAADAGWQISAGTQAFQLTLPPQGLTEAMHKGRNLPVADILPGQPIDFRFTPPAVFNLRASTTPQRFVEAPWNLRRLLGYPAQPTPGAVLDQATFEMVYGLSVKLTPDAGLLLAEIGARLGRLADSPAVALSWQHTIEQKKGYDAYTGNWAERFAQLRTRVAVLEPWTASEPEGLVLPRDKDQLEVHLRSGADLAYPFDNPNTADGPIPDNIPQGSLRGSFSWAFDIERVYRSIWNPQIASSSEMHGLAFSSLGGWGEFTARFAGDKTTIIASVRMGRIQTLTIEQIGRIGNFWNKAKLVTTYERTVAPTRQFYSQQQPLLGNPVLRKTAEYVQLLQKKREADPADTVGAYSACEFPEGDPPKIPVDSAWGENVGRFGYRIPLWRPGAQPTDVYKKPGVRLHLKNAVPNLNVPAADNTVRQFIGDPEKLCFYTTTDPSLSADTDQWPKQLGVDFTYVTLDQVAATNPVALAQSVANSQGKVKDFKVDPDPWVQPGLGAFTYNLEPGSGSSDITAGLPGNSPDRKPIGTAMRNITIMRGLDKSAVMGTADTVYAKSLQIPDHVSNILRPIVSQIPASASSSDLAALWGGFKNQAVASATSCRDQLTAFAASVPATASQLCVALSNQLSSQLTTLSDQVKNEAAGLLSGVHDLLVPITPPADLIKLRSDWATLYGVIKAQLRFTGSEVVSLTTTLQSNVDSTVQDAITRLQSLDADLAGTTVIADALAKVQAAASALDAGLSTANSVIDGTLRPITGGNIDQLRQQITGLRNQIASTSAVAVGILQAGSATAIQQARTSLQVLVQNCADARSVLDQSTQKLANAAQAFQATTIEKTLGSIDIKLNQATDWNAFIAAANAELDSLGAKLEDSVGSHLTELQGLIGSYANLACGQILQTDLSGALASVQKILDPSAIGQFFDNLLPGLTTGDQVSVAVEDYLHGLENTAGQFIRSVQPQLTLPALPTGVPDTAMFLLRGFSDVPQVPQLNFGDVQFTALRFAQLDSATLLPFRLPNVNLTPLAGFANDLTGGNPINLIVPTFQLADDLIPYNLSNFDFNSLIPHIGGMDLSNLFQDLRLPDGDGKNVVVTHGIDPQSMSGWVDIHVDVRITDEVEVFSYFGVTVTLDGARFTADAHVKLQAGQPPVRTTQGAIKADWSLSVGGFDVVDLVGCTLSFDDSGHFKFDVTPDKVKLQAVLEFLSDLIANFFSGDGFTTSVTSEGVQTLLELPLPDIQSGTFGIANLSLMCSFGLVFAPFQIQFGLGLASPDSPFTLTVFILGGAGYLELDAAYIPADNKISTTFNIGIFASASLAISLGPISGGVYVYFGITVSYHAETGSAPDFHIALELMFIGQVSLLGFISVALVLSLTGTYDSTTHVLIGRGTVHYSIKISFFFTINVNAGVSYTFSNHIEPVPLAASPDPALYDAAAAEYLAMFN